MGAWFALCALGRSSIQVACTGSAVGAAATFVTAKLLHLAAGKPALQVLAGSLMLASSIVASLVWPCTPWCAAMAGIPLALTGT